MEFCIRNSKIGKPSCGSYRNDKTVRKPDETQATSDGRNEPVVPIISSFSSHSLPAFLVLAMIGSRVVASLMERQMYH